jgi:hypothetical protein
MLEFVHARGEPEFVTVPWRCTVGSTRTCAWSVVAYFGMCWLHVPALLSSRLGARSTDLWLSMRCMVHGGEDGA